LPGSERQKAEFVASGAIGDVARAGRGAEREEAFTTEAERPAAAALVAAGILARAPLFPGTAGAGILLHGRRGVDGCGPGIVEEGEVGRGAMEEGGGIFHESC